jgi:small-conductance mechanosensitive channel
VDVAVIKEFFAQPVGNALLSLALAALVFVAGKTLFAVLRRILALEGLRVSANVFLSLVAVAAFEHVFAYEWAPAVGKVLQAVIFIVGVYLLYVLLEQALSRRAFRDRQPPEVPRIVRDVLRLAVIVLATLFALKAFLGFEPTALIATSTVLSAVIGLAMQDVLANIFAGISLQIGKPFRVGDWVTVYNQTGTVVSTSWRSTRIKTRDNHLVEVPNANIAKTEIYNYSVPTPLQRRSVEVGIVYGQPPNKVKAVLIEAALAAQGVLKKPEPDVLLVGFGDFAITYRLRFWLNDFADTPRTEDRIMTNIWYRLKRAGIEIPFPIRDVNVTRRDEGTAAREERAREARVMSFLEGVELLDALGKKDKEFLAAAAPERKYAVGEQVVRQGDPGDEFFIVVTGEVSTTVKRDRGPAVEIGKFGPGFFFGEMSLLTGEPRRATITAVSDVDVLVINKDIFAEIIAANPKVAHKLSRAIEKRRAEIEQEFVEAGDENGAARVQEKYSKENVLQRIKEFFDLR